MKFIVNLVLLSAAVNVLEAETVSSPMTKLEERLLDMVVDCKSCKLYNDKQDREKKRPAFLATLSTHPVTLSGTGTIIKFDRVILNRGEGYDPKTGIFTAPISGLYRISSTVMSNNGKELHAFIAKNNENIMKFYGAAIHGSTETAISILELKKGDTVAVKHLVDTTQDISGGNYSHLSGYYISD